MRALAVTALCAVIFCLTSCAHQDEESQKTQEAGGSLPWNRPASWEGGGVLGSQMGQYSH
ncbi:hypothetical protein BH09VER1_BH09VER1_50190 [soil metagenome]